MDDAWFEVEAVLPHAWWMELRKDPLTMRYDAIAKEWPGPGRGGADRGEVVVWQAASPRQALRELAKRLRTLDGG